ncbi:hypothetical protein VP01_1087g3, partial [Puccinia sorghi]
PLITLISVEVVLDRPQSCRALLFQNTFASLLQSQHPNVIDCVKKLPASGMTSTMALLKEIVWLLAKNKEEKLLWGEYVLEEGIQISILQKPTSGNYPRGSFQSSSATSAILFQLATIQR